MFDCEKSSLVFILSPRGYLRQIDLSVFPARGRGLSGANESLGKFF